MSSIRILVAPLLVALLLVSVAAPAGRGVQLSREEQQLLAMVNNTRRAHKLRPLAVSGPATHMARAYAGEMVTGGFVEHTSPLSGTLQARASRWMGTGWSFAGENISGAPDVGSCFALLMASPTHRANILDKDFTHVGMTVVRNASFNGTVLKTFVVQEFVAYKKQAKKPPKRYVRARRR